MKLLPCSDCGRRLCGDEQPYCSICERKRDKALREEMERLCQNCGAPVEVQPLGFPKIILCAECVAATVQL